MQTKKAVITSASPDQHTLPLQSVVDRHGSDNTALGLIIEEAVDAGIDEICVVICPGGADAYRQAAGEHANRLTFIEQDNPLGYGDALLRAKSFVGDEPFLHLVGDHLYLSRAVQGCAQQLVLVANEQECSVSAVQPTRENKLSFFGCVGGTRIAGRKHLYDVTTVVEKPTPTQAEQELIVAGLRAGYYLCFFGMHVLTPAVMSILETLVSTDGQRIQLSEAMDSLAEHEKYVAFQIEGDRYNIGVKYGLLRAQLAIALSGNDRDRILTELIDLLAR